MDICGAMQTTEQCILSSLEGMGLPIIASAHYWYSIIPGRAFSPWLRLFGGCWGTPPTCQPDLRGTCGPLCPTGPTFYHKLDQKNETVVSTMQANDHNSMFYKILLCTPYSALILTVFSCLVFLWLSAHTLWKCKADCKVSGLIRWSQTFTTTTALLFRKRFSPFNTGLKMSYYFFFFSFLQFLLLQLLEKPVFLLSWVICMKKLLF